MFLALELSNTVDLSQYSRLLWQRKLSHQIIDREGQQLVVVAREDQVDAARELFRQWQANEIAPAEQDSVSLGGFLNVGAMQRSFLGELMRAPLTLTLVAVCIVLWFLAPLEQPTALTEALLYPDLTSGVYTIVLTRVLHDLTLVKFLQMLSPMLLHGPLMHIVFNMLWLWELGRRIERVQRSWVFALAIIVIAFCSNTTEYFALGGNNFGGMSGVVYGLFGYIGSWQFIDPRKGLNVPGAMLLSMLAMLAIFTVLNLEMIANAAHLGGFVTGLVYGGIAALISRMRRTNAARGY